ncbi:MAG: C39 family peptidase [Bacteroidales bacterium]
MTSGAWPGKKVISMESYQQTTEYTCGPAAVLSLLKFYGKNGDEMTIAQEMGTSNLTGTTPQQMTQWLNSHNFIASWHEEGSLEMLQANIENNIPTLVEWSDWGGHWVVVIGYDTRGTTDPMDDVVIFADPYDRHDDHNDGYTWFNAQRFYYMWYDALLFGTVMKRVFISAVPG